MRQTNEYLLERWHQPPNEVKLSMTDKTYRVTTNDRIIIQTNDQSLAEYCFRKESAKCLRGGAYDTGKVSGSNLQRQT